MVFLSKLAGTLALATAFSGVLAHPGEKHDVNAVKREIMLRNLIGEHNRRALELCAGSEADVTLKARAIERRAATLKALREKRGIPTDAPLARRSQSDLNKYAALSHKSSAGYTLATDPSTIFAQNATCVLVPEVTIGPYWVAGELIREDITDGQAGVPLHLDIQFVDVNTCSGASDMLVDAWHCNALGVYSGVSATGQGGLDTTYCRGVQQSDDEGVVEFDTVFPGHYTGRAVHIHLKTTTDATVYDNNTYVDGVTHHIGQIFFDQSLISTVEASSPYTSNKQTLMQNTADSIAASESTSTHDPFVDYVLLGSSITDGVLGWITIGVDMKADHSSAVSAAAHYYASGGVSTGGSSGGGGGPPRK